MKHLHYTSLDSTQDAITKHLDDYSDEDYLLLSSDHQTKGKGRHGRIWDETDSALFLSLVMPPANTITLTTLELAIIVSDYFNEELKLKWPNDIFTTDQKKCGGILVDIKKGKLIAGIGINTQPHQDYGSVNIDKSLKIKEVILELAKYISLNRLSDSEIIETWSNRCLHLNRDVEIIDQDQVYLGKFIGIGLNGQAILKINNKVKEFYSGSLKIIS